MLFTGWNTLLRTLIVSLLAYPAALVVLRISGHRTLSKINAFDLVVTIALGSILATVVTSSETSLAQGILAFSLLVAFQFIVARAVRYSRFLESLVNGEPVLLYYHGAYLEKSLREARVTHDEIKAAMHAAAVGDIRRVHSVILETNGSLSVITADQDIDADVFGPIGRLMELQHAEAQH